MPMADSANLFIYWCYTVDETHFLVGRGIRRWLIKLRVREIE